ncbi:PAS domain-containing sensor histidine kinase [candidate division WOR-3 bacterium]|nr:PAS domain-containing sensor histidine kinase [candidate division WOR-3 bacterium]
MFFKKSGFSIPLYPVVFVILVPVSFLMIWFSMLLMDNGEKAVLSMTEKELLALSEAYNQSIQQLYSSGQVKEKLLKLFAISTAHIIEKNPQITAEDLKSVVIENNLARIDILDSTGRVTVSSSEDLEIPYYPGLKFLTSGKRNEIIIWSTERADSIIGIPFRSFKLAAVRTDDNGAVVVYLDESWVASVMSYASVSKLVKDVGTSPGFAYVAVQGFEGIISASGKITQLCKIEEDSVLLSSVRLQKPIVRETDFRGKRIYEVISPLSYEGVPKGVIRIGIYLDDYQKIISDYRGRILFMFLFLWLAVLLSIIASVLGIRYFSLRRELHSAESVTTKLVDSSNYGIFIVNAQGKFLRINEYGRQLFGLGNKDEKKMKYGESFPDDELHIKRTYENEREMKDVIVDIVLPSGKKEEFLLDTVMLRENDEIIGVVSFLKDFKYFKIEKELQSEKEKIRDISRMTSAIAHELRNPLNAASIAVQRLQREFEFKEEDERKTILAMLSSAVDSLERKLGNLLMFAKTSKSSGVEVDLLVVLSDLKKIHGPVNMITQSDSESIVIKGDKTDFYRLFDNLIDNSIKAGAENIRINIAGMGEKVLIYFEDDGHGIDERHSEEIFEPYFTTSPSGTGLGLYIVKKIAEDYEGSVEVEKKRNNGAMFKIVLSKNVKNRDEK